MKKIKSLFWIGTMALLTLAGCNNQQAKPHVHTYDLEHPDWAWTELAAGGYSATATIECTSCKESNEGHLLTLDANVTHQQTLDPTCTTPGEMTYTAVATYEEVKLRDTKVVPITDAEAHQYVEVAEERYLKTAATCTEDAVYFKSCKFCHKNSTETFVAENTKLGHNLQHFSASESTCQLHGNVEYWKCLRCGKFFLDEACTQETTEEETLLPFADHIMEHHAGKAATCTAGGTKEYWTCSYEPGVLYRDEQGNEKFNNESELEIAPLGHNMEHHAAVPASCTAQGSLEYWTCDRCEKMFLDENGTQECTAQDLIVQVTEHTYVNSAVTDKIGYLESKCSTCGLSNGLTSDLMTLADIDFTKAQYGAQGGKWGTNVQPTAKTMVFEVTAASTENEIKLPRINFSLYKIVSFTLSGNDWSARVGLETGSYAFPYAYRAEPYSGTLSFTVSGNQVNASLYCAEGTTQNVTISDSDIVNGNKSVSLYMIADAEYRTISAELTALADTCEHNYVLDANCLGKEVCSICGEARAVAPSIDFATNGIYGMYDWYTSFGAPDAGWVFNVEANSIHFYTYNPSVYSEVCLPRMYFAGFSAVTIDFTIANASEKYSFNSDLSNYYTVPSASFAAKLVFYNITSSSMVASLRDSSNNILLSKVVTDANVLNGVDGFKFYDEGVGLGDEHLSNFAFVGEHAHNYTADAGCIGKEACSVCYEEHGVASPSFDFSSNLYGAYDYYEGNGSIDSSWVVANGASEIKFVNAFSDGSIFDYHLPKIYFANFSSVTINLVINYASEVFALENGFSQSFTAPSSNYDHAQLVFENISSSSMTVKLNDAFGTTYAQVTCSNANVLNGNEGFVLYAKGSGNIAYDALNNFTFVA